MDAGLQHELVGKLRELAAEIGRTPGLGWIDEDGPRFIPLR